MSDRKYRTVEQLHNDVSYNRRMQNTHMLRANSAQEELERRAAELKNKVELTIEQAQYYFGKLTHSDGHLRQFLEFTVNGEKWYPFYETQFNLTSYRKEVF